MTLPDPPYYHGSSERGAQNILDNGINLNQTQARDRGFFGDGFYVASRQEIAQQHATTVGPDNPAILAIDIDPGARILTAGETFSPGTVRPESNPSWHEEFIEWSLQKVEDAAVWEYATDRSKDDIMASARAERTPSSPKFNREKWYREVTEYAAAHGFPVVYWTDGEIIIRDPTVVTTITRVD